MGIKTLCKAAFAAALMAALTAVPGSMHAQTPLPANAPGLLLNSDTEVNMPGYEACEVNIPAFRKGRVSVISNSEWLKARFTDDDLQLTATTNANAGSRIALVNLTNSSGQKLQLTVRQPGVTMPDVVGTSVKYVHPTSASGGNPNSSAEDINKTLDGNLNTMYHSSYSGFTPRGNNCPELTYYFADGTPLEAVIYTTRQDGSNGNFGEVEISLQYGSDGAFTKVLDYDFKKKNGVFTVDMPAEVAGKTIYGVRFKVLTGQHHNGEAYAFASCAEMQFVAAKDDPEYRSDMAAFADDICSKLAPGVDAARVAQIKDPMLHQLAESMLSGQYSSEGRVSTHQPLIHTQDLSAMWNAPGKQYDRLQGVTGIMMGTGRSVIMVSGIPEHLGTVTLKVMGWDSGEGNGYFEETHTLHNGANVIDRTANWNGLAYVANFDTEGKNNGTASPVTTHFLYGAVNGVLSHDYNNEQMAKILANAKYACIDCVGSRVHSVWEVSALKQYANNEWTRYLNVLDILIFWEHRTLGLTKYNRVPENKTFAYVNHTYYMFQGALGVSFKEDTQYRVCNPQHLMYNDDDAIWGLSHEWGHQHQMHPYMTWAAMAEVTNNFFSYTNIMQMGYYQSDKINDWPKARDSFLRDRNTSNGTTVSESRQGAYERREKYSWCSDFYKLCEANSKPVISSYASNPRRAVQHSEMGIGQALCPLIMLSNYALLELKLPDFLPDLHEAMRQNDNPEGSTVEKQNGLDKYELLASAQNYNKNDAIARYREAYPNSVWTTGGYITPEHCGSYYENSAPFILNFIRKTSRLYGYNLFPYFERWGFLRCVANYYFDYADTYILLTDAAYDEFKADMDALVASGELKAMPDGMVEAMSNTRDLNRQNDMMYNTPNIPNDRPVNADDF